MANDQQRVLDGSTFSQLVYGRAVPLPAGNWELLPAYSRNEPSGFKAQVYVDVNSHRIYFANAGTNDQATLDVINGYKDVKGWPDIYIGAHSHQWSDMLSAAKAVNDLVQPGGQYAGFTVDTTGHSWGEAMAQAQTYVFGWEGTGFDGPGAGLMVNGRNFTQILQSLNITPVQGTDFISFNTAGVGPFGGGIVGLLSQNIPGTRDGLVTTPGSYASAMADLLFTLTGGALLLPGGPEIVIPGVTFFHSLAQMGLGIPLHSMDGIYAGAQAGQVSIATQPGTIPIPLPPDLSSIQPPIVINDGQGNVIATVLDSSGQVVTNINGNPIFRLELNAPSPTPMIYQGVISLNSTSQNTATYDVTKDGQQPQTLKVITGGSGQTYDVTQRITVADISGAHNTINISGTNSTVSASGDNLNVAPGAQSTIIGSGNTIFAQAQSTLRLTAYDSTLTTDVGVNLVSSGTNDRMIFRDNAIVQDNTSLSTLITSYGVEFTELGHNNNLILGFGSTVDLKGSNNTVIGVNLAGSVVDQGAGNQFISPQNLSSDVSVRISSSRGFDATIDNNGVAHIQDGGLDGGIADGTAFEPGPDPNWSEEGDSEGSVDPDPLINGHSFILPGDLTLIAGDGNNSLNGGLNKNVIVAGNGNNVIGASGTENTVAAGDGNNVIAIGGLMNTVVLGAGQNSVTASGQNDTILGGPGNLVLNYGPGNHTIIAGTGAARSAWNLPILDHDPGLGIPFANIIRSDSTGYTLNSGMLGSQFYAPYRNLIIGGPGSNYIEGGWGDNTITGGESVDRLIGGHATSVFGGQSLIHGGSGDDIISGGIGGDTIVYGDGGNDTIDGGHSKSTLYGGDGNDIIRAASDYDSVLYGEAGEDQLVVGITSGNVTLDGGTGNDRLIGGSSSFVQTFVFGRGYGFDTIEGVTSRGVLALAPGLLPEDLTLQTNSHGDLLVSITGSDDHLNIRDFFGEGTWAVTFSDGTKWSRSDVVSRTAGLVLADTTGGQHLVGSPLADTLSGPGRNSVLDGQEGADTYLVGLGDGVTTIQEYPYDGTNNTLLFGAGIIPDSVTFNRTDEQGIVIRYGDQGDAVHVANFDPFNPDTTLGIQTIEFEDGTTWDAQTILSRTPGLSLTSTPVNSILLGSPMGDVLSGVGGNARLEGKAGNDTYLFDRGYGQETIFDHDLSGTALNTIVLGSTIAPADVTAQLSSDGSLLLNFNGTTDQLVIANFIERSFQGFQVTFNDGTLWDRDALIAQVASFPLVADPTGSALTGTSFADTLIGLGGNDFLDGLGGNDVMTGGGGDDLYYVYSPGDQVIEQPGQGHDIVRSYIDYTLPENVEDLQLSYAEFSGPIPIVGIGNAENNDIRGNFQSNILQGGAGDDTLWGGYSDPSFGPGNDDLSGGTGNDTYYVDGASFNGVDTIHDASLPGEGNRLQLGPSVRSSDLTFEETLGSLFIGVGMAGDGVVLADFDPTNAAGSMVVDTISFSGGIEQKVGGFDVSLADFLKPSLLGTGGSDDITGTAGVDIVRADAGDDTITGGLGNDVLIGGAGQDTYVFHQGDGSDLIDDMVQPGEANRLVFGAGITPDSLQLEYGGTANQGVLTLHSGSGTDALTFVGFFPDDPTGSHPIETFEFADGTTVGWDQLLQSGVDVRGTSESDGDLFGTFANDQMLGFAGEESLSAGQGDDVLVGGTENDVLLGGLGADTYVYNMGDGRDQISDEAEEITDPNGNTVFVDNRIAFGSGVSLTDIDLAERDGRLFVGVGSSGEGIDAGTFVDSELGIRTLSFAEGLSLSLPDLAQAVLFSDDSKVITAGTGDTTTLGGNGNDILTGGSGSSVLIGWKGDDVLRGGLGSTRFYGGTGNDFLEGNEQANDTYVFNIGDGVDTIKDTASGGIGNRIQFGAGITQPSLVFTEDKVANRLTIQVGSSGLDIIHLEGFSLTEASGSVVVQTLSFADGSTVQLADLLATPGLVSGTATDDILIGTSGDETLRGGPGNDTLVGGEGSDTYVFNLGNGVDTIIDFASPGAGNVLQFGSGITPNDLSLGLGSLLIRVGTNGDAVHLSTFSPVDVLGARTIDTFRFADGTSLSYEQLIARGFDLMGTSGDDIINGTTVTDRILGLAGDDFLVGSQGADTLVGGPGNDTYSVDSVGDVVTEQPNEGIDSVLSAVSYTLGPNVENLTLAGGSAINGTGNELNNVLVGNNGSNVLDGGPGVDTMSGGNGNDIYVVDNVDDVVTEQPNAGTDTVQASITYTLEGNVENLTLIGTAAINGTGNTLDNVLVGNSGSNVLDGGLGNDRLHGAIGADTLLGRSGDDTYRFDTGDGIDTVEDIAALGEGNRILFGTGIVQADLTFVQDRLARKMTIQVGASGTDKIILTNFDPSGTNGSLVVETLAFADGSTAQLADLLATIGPITGTAGDDVLTGTVGDDVINALGGNDTVTGLGGADTIDGGAGNDLLDGGAGADTLFGGLGDDTYVIDDAGDVVTENLNEGIDTVQSGLNYTLGANVENLTLTGSANLTGTGNALNNSLTGNSGDNALDGGVGADTLVGGTGNDSYIVDNVGDVITELLNEGTDTVQSSVSYTLSANVENLILTGPGNLTGTGNTLDNALTGTSGDNTLDGQGGADTLIGGLGNDTYVVDNIGDVVAEQLNEGTDTVQASISYSLGANVENLTLTGTAAINGTGNALDNVLTGNSAANSLIGGAGNDAYVVSAGDTVVEVANQGLDTVVSDSTWTLGANLENLTLIGTAAINGIGNTLNNVITGNSANNTLNGGAGADTLVGGLGNDIYVVDNVGDVVTELVNEGTDTVQASISYVLGADVENLTLTGAGAITGTGNSLNNQLTGNSAANVLTGGAGDDLYVVGTGDTVVEQSNDGTDTVQSAITWTLGANIENLILTGAAVINGTGNALNNVITGNSAANTLDGGAGDDTLSGGAGADTLVGGLGNDTYVVDNVGDVITELLNEGTDTVQSGVSYTLSANVENLTLTGTGALSATGNTGDNVLTCNSGNNVLDGGAGADTLVGGLGNDIYVVDNLGDVVMENVNEGTDTVQASITYALGANVESLTLTGTATINATGNAGNNVLTGNSAANVLDGGGGTDTLRGGVGDDTYVIDDATDVVTENLNEGTDTVQSSLNYTLGANIENLTLTGGADLTGIGNSLNNLLIGNSGANTLNGGTGADTMAGGAGDDIYLVENVGDVVTEQLNEGVDTVQSSVIYTLSANVENLTLTGNAAINGTGNSLGNILTGNAGANVLDGGTGADTLLGGKGNDTYLIDDVGDVVTENLNEGTDTVQAFITYTLGANLENLALTGTAAMNGTGNALNNVLTGNNAANVLDGGDGNDTLDGGAGTDTLVGGLGNDTYVVDDVNDLVTEALNEGADTVQSSVSYTLSSNVENLILTGPSAINGTGNDLNNVLTGNSAANILTGGLGNDTYVVNTGDTEVENANEGTDTVQSDVSWTLGANLENLTLTGGMAINGTGNALNNVQRGNSAANVLTGGAGNDTYVVSIGDTVVENANEGTDTVQSDVSWTLGANIENLTLTGTAAINATGNSLSNTLTGNAAANQLTGGIGNDTLRGGLGNDTYLIARGDGQDVISENDGTVGNSDTLLYGSTINPLDLVISRQVNALRLSVHGSTDTVTIQNWYSAPTMAQLETIQAGNGQALLNTQVDQLIQAMASFSQQTGLTWDQAIDQRPQEVQTVLAANWH